MPGSPTRASIPWVANALLNSFVFDDPAELHDDMCTRLLTGRMGHQFNWVGSSEVGLDCVTLASRSFDLDYNLADLWLTRSRWNTMVRQYINPGNLNDTLGMVSTHLAKSKRKSGTATLRLDPWTEEAEDAISGETIELQTRTVQGTKSGRQVRRRWGSCMLALTYRNVPHPTVTLTSRTTYFGYLAIMDMAVANVFAQLCGDRVGIHPADIRFVWHINLAQFHGFRSLAVATTPRRLAFMDRRVDDPRAVEKLRADGRMGMFRTIKGYQRILKSDRAGVLYGDESFSSFARVRRRFHTQVHGFEYASQFDGGTRLGNVRAFAPVPDLHASTLDFTPIGHVRG